MNITMKKAFEFTPEVLSAIGSEFEYFIVNGPHYLQRYAETKYNTIASCMVKQLKTLHSAGMKIHYEFSGNTGRKEGEGAWTGIKYFADILKGHITSMGINHKELKEVVAGVKAELDPTVVAIDGDDSYSLYRNAISLAEYLGVDRLYIHGHSTDITVRRNTTREGLETEVHADMHAKQRVVEWLQGEKSGYPTPEKKKPSGLLKREGFTDLMRFAETLADTSGLWGIDKVRFMRDVAVNGFEPPKKRGYSAVIVPVKWIYGETKVTTSSGDITSSTALIQSGL
jgi:ADP-dependent phosphofructokinase/glucokinase